MSLSLAREIALDAFVQVMKHGQKPEEVLEQYYQEHDKALRRLDRNFIKEILYGGLRWYSKLFWILCNTAKRDLNKSSPEIQAALIVGTYQIYYMDRVPDRAAVNESVEYIRKKGQASACSFVNGVLRQIARRAEYFPKPDKTAKPVEYLALQFSHPEWMVRRWIKHFRFERLEAMLASNNVPPPYTARINSIKTPITQMLELQQCLLKNERTHTEKRSLRTALRFREAPSMDAESMFQQGYYTIQDEAAQLVGFLVAPEPGQVVADVCAGPGGKLSHVYELMNGEGTLYAVEQDQRQLQRAKENMERMQHNNVTWVHQDFMNWKPEKPLDKILLDAPCTGMGVLRRHPEGKWQKNEAAINQLAQVQRQMILHALKSLKKGGELIYSVCSFEPEESEQHLEFLQKECGHNIEVISPVSRLPDYFKKYVTRNNLLMVYIGNQDEMDGFAGFIVRLVNPL